MTSSPIGLLTISTDGGIEGVDCLKVTGRGTQITGLNINENSFSDALNHELVKLRQSGINDLHEKCKSCKYLYGCAEVISQIDFLKKMVLIIQVYTVNLFWLLSSGENDLIKE